jgi:hypothetical protein
MDMPNTRSEAVAFGSSYYITGIVCKHGHAAPRYTMSGACTECLRVNNRIGRDKIRRAFAEAVSRSGMTCGER